MSLSLSEHARLGGPPTGCGGSWLGCQVFPAMGTISILELAANSGSSRTSKAPNLHLATKLNHLHPSNARKVFSVMHEQTKQV